MKKSVHYTICMVLSWLAISMTSYAQSQQQTTPTPLPLESTGTVAQQPQRVTDEMVSNKLKGDLNTRNSATQTQTIDWYQTDYGYTGKYSIGSAKYMARYDQQGNYVEILRRNAWTNATVPTTLSNAFRQSPLKNHTVTGYWSVIDAGKSGYFLELRDQNGTASTIWVDSQGKFTTAPYSSTTATPNN